MALTIYEGLTQALLQAPSSPIALIPTATLDIYINQSRLQVAAQGRCIRVYPTLALAAGQQVYQFSSITGLGTGVVGIFHIRQVWLQIPGVTGQVRMTSRPFEWFGLYALNKLNPQHGQPKRWAQLGEGLEGSIFVDPVPDLPYTLSLDVLGVPANIATDNDPEAIPDIWRAAVPFYAAWWAFQSAQRQADADMVLKRFQEHLAYARAAANPDLIMENWSQSPDPEEVNRLGSRVQ